MQGNPRLCLQSRLLNYLLLLHHCPPPMSTRGLDLIIILRRGRMSPGNPCRWAVRASCRPSHLMARAPAKSSDSSYIPCSHTDKVSGRKKGRQGARKEGGTEVGNPRSPKIIPHPCILSTNTYEHVLCARHNSRHQGIMMNKIRPVP